MRLIPNFNKKDLFWSCKRLRPRPPHVRGWHIVPQSTSANFLPPVLDPQMNCLARCSISSHTLFRISIDCMKKLGIVKRTDCIRVKHPAMDSCFASQLHNFDRTFFITNCTVDLEILLWSKRIPKYLPNSYTFWYPKILLSLSLKSSATPFEKNMLVFLMLTQCPEKLQNWSRMFFSSMPCLISAFEKITKSSTKNKYEKLGSVLDNFTGTQSLEEMEA
ncbi:hypothetical protein V6Z11_D09G128700 [Gossypium hirsutum]